VILLYVLGKHIIRGIKLPNSGDTLKWPIPNQDRKVLSGWTNHPCTVTTRPIDENKIGYRGSKSNLTKFVKEQRVDGSWYTGSLYPVYLRYTLMGFERNYQIRIPSKRLNIRNFSSSIKVWAFYS